MKSLLLALLISMLTPACNAQPDNHNTETTRYQPSAPQPENTVAAGVKIIPIEHATMILVFNGETIYVDPVGGKEAFRGQPSPDLILVTDIHHDHMSAETIEAVKTENTKLIVPQAVATTLPSALKAGLTVLSNDDMIVLNDITIWAIPMYNLRKEALKYHPKGRGNGYVLSAAGKTIYISGDTEGTPEMRNLKNIDIAFVCMNLPYTMSVEDAADAVLDFKPKTVYPYHYRGEDGFSDVEAFKQIVEKADPSIKVVLLDWYPNRK